MPNPTHNQPSATGTLSPSNPIVFGQIPARNNAIVPVVSANPGVFSDFFARRSFHRVAFILGLGSFAVAGWYVYQHYLSEKAKKAHEEIAGKENAEETMMNQNSNDVNENEDDLLDRNVILYQCPRGYFTPCIAPFALKLETFLRVANIPYEIKFKGQPQSDDAPWITIGQREIVESQRCIPSLCHIFSIDLNKDASESRKSAANLVDNTLDNRIFWGIALWRWVYDNGNSMKEIQPVAVPMASQMIQDVCESVKKASWYHGIGRHSREEVIEKVNKDLNDLSVALGKHNFFMGERPGEVDCNAFAMLSQMVWNMPKSPFELKIKKYPNLIGFIFRMKEKYWPDWSDILHSADTESTASENVRLYSTGEFTRSRTGVSSQSSKSSSVRISREPSVSSASKARNSNPEIRHNHNSSPQTNVGSNDNNFHGLRNSMIDSELRKVNSERSPNQTHENREQHIENANNLNLSQSQPEQNQLHHNSNTMTKTNPFIGETQTLNNNMSRDEITKLISTIANEQMLQNSPPSQFPTEYYPKNQGTTNFSFNGQQQYQNSFAASKPTQFSGQINPATNQPISTQPYPPNVYNSPQQQYGNYDAAYHDQAKFYQIRDAIHAVTAQSAGRENYSTNISKLNQILNGLSISQPQTGFEHSNPHRQQWNNPIGHQQLQQQMYYNNTSNAQYDQQQQQQQPLQQQPMMNSPSLQLQNPNNPFM